MVIDTLFVSHIVSPAKDYIIDIVINYSFF